MKKVVLVFLCLVPGVVLGHPLPPGHCDTSTILAGCAETCKEQVGTIPPILRGRLFSVCFGQCVVNIDCGELSQLTSLFTLKSASDTPQIEGIWAGNFSVSSEYGFYTFPATLTVELNEFGVFQGTFEISTGVPDETLLNPVFASLTEQSPEVWSLALSGVGASGQGTLNLPVQGDDTFTLEYNCVISRVGTSPFLRCPWNGKGTLTRQVE